MPAAFFLIVELRTGASLAPLQRSHQSKLIAGQ